jgi:hypothetical protein
MGEVGLRTRVIAGHSRPQDGVASLAYDPAIQLLRGKMDPRVKPAGDG